MKFILLLSFIVMVFSFFKRNELTKKEHISSEINQQPIQKPIEQAAFSVNIGDVDYVVQPQYYYELYGLVVSYKQHNSDTGAHARWGDHLNVADVCVVWSENAFEDRLGEMKFWNLEWTCYYQAPNREIHATFNGHQLSNNHLISENLLIRDVIQDIGIGDQIRVKGWLSSYGSRKGAMRGTSTTRTDTGNGACETIYVNEIEIINSHTNTWRKLMYFSFAIFLLCLIRYFTSPVTQHRIK